MGSNQTSMAVESKQNNEEIRDASFDAAKFNRRFEKINNSLFKDPSTCNIIYQFGKSLKLQPPTLSNLVPFVDTMQKNWKKVYEMSKELRQLAGDQEMDDLDDIKNEYRALLLKTRKVVSKLVVSSKVQSENAQQLSQLIKSFNQNKQKFTYQEKLTYDDCMSRLKKWIDQKDLSLLIKGWDTMIAKLKKKSKVWQGLKEKSKRTGIIGAIVGCLAVLVVVAAVVVIGVGGIGSVGAIVAGPIIKSAMEKSHLIAGWISGATGAVALQQVQNALLDILNVSESMQEDLNGMINKKDAVVTHYDDLRDTLSFMKMKDGLRNIINYLDEYKRQGEEIDGSINKAFEVLRNLRC